MCLEVRICEVDCVCIVYVCICVEGYICVCTVKFVCNRMCVSGEE